MDDVNAEAASLGQAKMGVDEDEDDDEVEDDRAGADRGAISNWGAMIFSGRAILSTGFSGGVSTTIWAGFLAGARSVA